MEEEVLITVNVEQSEAITDLDKTEQSIRAVTEAQKELDEEMKAGTKTVEEYNQEKSHLDSQLEKEQTNRRNLTDVIDKETASLGGNKSKLQSLLDERGKLDVSTTEGAKKHKLLTNEIDGLTSSTGKAKKATGEFGQGIEQYAGALDQFGVGASGAIDKVKGLTTASLQFLATPIGAIIGAIVVALGTLASYFKNTGDGADKFAKIMAQLGAITDVLIDRVSNFGRGLFALLTGDIEAGLFQMTQAFKGVGDEIVKETEAAGEMADALDALEDAEKDYNVQAGKTRNEIKLLEIQARDRSKTEQERANLLQKALNKEVELNKELTRIRTGQLQAAADEAGRRANMQQQENESLQAFADRLVANEKLSDELRDKVRDGIKALNQAEGESLTFQEKLQTKRNDLLEKGAEAQKKALEATKKANEEYHKWLLENTANIYEVNKENNEQQAKDVEDLNNRAAASFATTMKGIIKTNREAQEQQTKDVSLGAEARRIIQSEEFQNAVKIAEGSLALAKQITKGITADREAAANEQIDKVTLQARAETLILQSKYDDDLAALEQQLADKTISEDQFKEAKKKLDDDYAKSKKIIDQQAAYDEDQIKKATFEQNKKIRIADSTIDTIQSAIAAYRSLAGIPFVGPALGAIAAAAALKFGYANIQRIKEQQYIGSGAQPPAAPESPISADGINVAGNISNAPSDGGIAVDSISQPVNDKLGGPNITVESVVSVKEITDIQNQVKAKEDLASVS